MSEEIEEQIEGMVDKDKKYRDRLIANIKHKKDHPFHNGIHMAAHHLISKEAVNVAQLGSLLIHRGYNINLVENLVFLPSTLQGACQLRVQLHRGDHIFALPDQESYHDQVVLHLKMIKAELKKCTPKTSNDDAAQRLVDKESKKVLKKIAEFRVPLTSIYKNFKPSSKVGCSNHNEISDCEGSISRCINERNHIGKIDLLNPNAAIRKVPKTIKYEKSYYQLKIGS
ncbi:hypothetical protein BB427_13355 [Pseudoalteromonas sp. BMB]|uniref:AHH domain-containing protein n=1 Tax=Pseudoalteromonas sp. BMB TaxID=1874619 RepID=UPI00083DE5A3|nr:AHH domain-containing protein [Pseudoalteromonas sp. BMB]ODB37471.1 hypothetical protein BB427_13355 [Pseudoalteromonas sp. BMB]